MIGTLWQRGVQRSIWSRASVSSPLRVGLEYEDEPALSTQRFRFNRGNSTAQRARLLVTRLHFRRRQDRTVALPTFEDCLQAVVVFWGIGSICDRDSARSSRLNPESLSGRRQHVFQLILAHHRPLLGHC